MFLFFLEKQSSRVVIGHSGFATRGGMGSFGLLDPPAGGWEGGGLRDAVATLSGRRRWLRGPAVAGGPDSGSSWLPV